MLSFYFVHLRPCVVSGGTLAQILLDRLEVLVKMQSSHFSAK